MLVLSELETLKAKIMRKILFVTIPLLVATAFLLLFSGLAIAGGGTWKMGPFGPYWDDNSWPEFTPMYWMEEFLNQLDDDDAEIQQWMMRNQYQGQGAQALQQPYFPREQGGAYPPEPQNNADTQPFNSMQLNFWSMPDQWDMPMSVPEQGASSANPPMADSGRKRMNRAQPNTRQLRAVPQQRAYPPAQAYPQQANRYPYQQRKPVTRPAPRSAYPEFESLPNLTPQEFSRMPPQLQQQYEQAFNQAFVNYQKRREIEQRLRQRPPVNPLPDRGTVPRNYPRY